MDNSEIKSLLQSLGERVPPGSQLILIGGGALALLGSPRLTIDIDFVGDDVHPSEFHQFIMQIAKELKIEVEPVPVDRFVPLPMGSTERKIVLVNLKTWKSMLPIHAALHSANLIAALTQISMTSFI